MSTTDRQFHSNDGEVSGDPSQSMRAALTPVVEVGPAFLGGTVPAEQMAHTMVQAVQDYVAAQQGRPQTEPAGREGRLLQSALGELYTCGSGFLAGRCDADCVARTMTQIVREFGDPATAGRA